MKQKLKTLSEKTYSFNQIREVLFVFIIILTCLFAMIVVFSANYDYGGETYEMWLSNYPKTVEEGGNISFHIHTDSSDYEKMFGVGIYFDGSAVTTIMNSFPENSVKVSLPHQFKANSTHKISVVAFDYSTGDWYKNTHELFYMVDVV